MSCGSSSWASSMASITPTSSSAAALIAHQVLPGTWYVLAGGLVGFATGFLFASPANLPDASHDGAP